jgi:4'-phosphopantetheinyl transferase
MNGPYSTPSPSLYWPVGPSIPNLGATEIHVWAYTLDQPLELYETLLARDEIERADRFKFPHLRQHFVVARGVLRLMLARYLATDAAELRFKYGAQGKPRVASTEALHFNLAHSGGLALVALAQRELGVDVEAIRPLPDHEQIARRFFSETEIEQLNTVPAAQQPLAFFNCWTRKEAFLKATGDGLSRPLDSFSVSMRPDEPASLLSINGQNVGVWQLSSIEPANNYVGAVAIPGQAWQISTWTWDFSR